MKPFVPGTLEALYHALRQTPGLRGEMKYLNDRILWTLSEELLLEITGGCGDFTIEIPRFDYHWHIEDEDVYSELCEVGRPGNVLILRKTLFCTSTVYCGPRANAPFPPNKKWRWGRLYYFD